MRTARATALRPYMVRLVKLLACWEPHFSCAQQLLAERMIIIVAYLRGEVVKFIFGGRNSGQSGLPEELVAFPRSIRPEEQENAR